MNIWLNISFQIPEAHLSHTSSKFSSHLMQPDNISANTESRSGSDKLRIVQSVVFFVFFPLYFQQWRKRLQPPRVTGSQPVTYIGGAHLTGEATARKPGRGRALGILPSLQIPSHSWQSSSVSGALVPIWSAVRCALDTRGCEAEWTQINCGDHDGVWWPAFSHGGVTLIPPRLGCHVKKEMESPGQAAEWVRTDLTSASDAFSKRYRADEGSVLKSKGHFKKKKN